MDPVPPTHSTPKGKLLRLKQGYNPNSSSIGTMIFAIPVAMLGAAVAFGAASGLIFSAFTKKNSVNESNDNQPSDTPSEK